MFHVKHFTFLVVEVLKLYYTIYIKQTIYFFLHEIQGGINESEE